MQVSDILRTKGDAVTTVAPDDRVEVAARLLGAHRIGALVVSADGASVDGIISERDIVAHIAALGAEALDSTVGAIMSRSVITCDPGDTVEQIMAVMTERRFRHLPVVVDGELRGIVSIGDAVARRVAELESEQELMRDYLRTGRT